MTKTKEDIIIEVFRSEIEELRREVTDIRQIVSELRLDLISKSNLANATTETTINCIGYLKEKIFGRTFALEEKVFPGMTQDLQKLDEILRFREPACKSEHWDRKPPKKS